MVCQSVFNFKECCIIIFLIFLAFSTSLFPLVRREFSNYYIITVSRHSSLDNCPPDNCPFQDEVVNFGTADVSEVETHSTHYPALTYHNANIENISIEDITKSLSCSEFYIFRIYFSTHWLPAKTTTLKFSPVVSEAMKYLFIST